MKIKLSNISLFIKAFKLVYACAPILTIISFILIFIQSFFPLFIIYLIKELIDAVTLAVSSTDKDAAFVTIKWIIFASGLAYLINTLANAISQYVREYQAQLFADFMYNRLHKKAVALDLEFFENPDYHDMFFRALQESPQRPLNIVNNIFYIIQYTLAVMLLTVFLLLSLHFVIGLVIIVVTLPLAIIRLTFSKKIYKWQYEHTQNERKAQYFSRILTGEAFAKELRLFRLQHYFIEKFKNIRTDLRNSKLKIFRKRLLSEIFFYVLSAVAIFSTYVFIAHSAVYGSLTVGMLVLYYMALQKGMTYFKDLMIGFSSLYEDSLYIANLDAFMKLENNTVEASESAHFPTPLNKGIVFKNVSFKYPNSTRNALSDINLNIKQGTVVALVGDNGAGKSTLVKLICNLYKVNQGTICFDGIDINNIIDKEIKSNVSVLFQDYVLYHLTVKENIGFGNVENIGDIENIKQAAQKASIDKLIVSLRDEYNTVLGKLFDNSEELSIGEWQKIAMARAFFKDAPVIILDEPTSALDPKAEADVFNKFKEITKGKTSVIVSHRFSTVKMADYIYVMEKEKIVEEGTHDSLMALNGKYASMFKIQADNYTL